MTAHPLQLLKHIRRMACPTGGHADSDAALLGRFVRGRDEGAFAALVRRHGPLVLGVCRRVLRDPHRAEDACQAVFLVLARKAPAVRPPDRLAAWLYGVARRVALKARQAEARRLRREAAGARARPAAVPPDPLDELTARELLLVLDEEVERLPAAYRLPVLLCCLEGKSREDAARQLGWTPASVKARLERGRRRLQQRLARRGLGLAAALALVAFSRAATAGVARGLAEATVRAVVAFASGSPARAVPAEVRALAEGGLKLATQARLKLGLLLLLGVGAVAAGWAGSARPGSREEPPEARPAAVSPKSGNPEGQARTDLSGDSLPAGAVARLGTVRLRHSNWVTGLAFLPDGKTLASTSWDHTIRLWDRATGKELRKLIGHTEAVLVLAVSANGKTLASAGNDGTVRVWESATGPERFRLTRPVEGGAVFCVALSPDGKILASGGGNGHRTLVLWDAITGKELRVLGDKQGTVTCAGFSPDGSVLACGCWDATVRLWEVATGRQLCRLRGHGRRVAALAFSPDGRGLFSGSQDDTIRLWDTATGRELLQLPGQGGVSQDPPGPGGQVQAGGVHSLALSPDGKVLASGGYNGTVRYWDAVTGKETVKVQAHSRVVQALAFSTDGKVLATGGYDHAINLWDAASGRRLLSPRGHEGTVHFVTFAPGGRQVASVSGDRTVRLWDVATGRERHALRGHKAWTSCAAFAPDGRTLASADEHGVILLWDVATGKEVRAMAGEDNWVEALAFSPDNKYLASGSWGSRDAPGSVRLWDPATGREVRKLREDPTGRFLELAFLPDGKAIAVQEITGIFLLDVATGKEIRRFAGQHRFALSSDGRVLAAGDSGHEICLWDVATGKERGRFPTLPNGLGRLALSPDGKTLTGAPDVGNDRTVWLWEVLTGKVRRKFEGHQGAVRAVAFSPDGRILISASEDTTLLVWDLLGAKGGRGKAP
jgi:RNA polymerase sigma factor (sigma-70 family)